MVFLKVVFFKIFKIPPIFFIFSCACFEAKLAEILILFFISPSPNILSLMYFLLIIFFSISVSKLIGELRSIFFASWNFCNIDKFIVASLKAGY